MNMNREKRAAWRLHTDATAEGAQLCRLIVVPDFEKYERFSRFMFIYAYDFTPEVEIASIDEGYFDLRGQRSTRPVQSRRRFAAPSGRAEDYSFRRHRASKLVSQIASKLRKPACFLEVDAGREREFLDPLRTNGCRGSVRSSQRR